MSHYVNVKGKIYAIENLNEVTRDELIAKRDFHREQIEECEKGLALFDNADTFTDGTDPSEDVTAEQQPQPERKQIPIVQISEQPAYDSPATFNG